MPRPRKEGGSERFFITLAAEEGERLRAHAASVGRRPTTVARELVLAGLAAANGGAGEDLAAAHRHIEELERQLESVFSSQRPPDEASRQGPTEPRWEWPVEELLADRAWWDRWLPRLYELLGRGDLGRGRSGSGFGDGVAVDERGCTDIMNLLFPAADGVSWRSPDCPTAAATRGSGPYECLLPPARPHVWEPVLRHVAAALCALEQAAQKGTDPVLRLDTVERIVGAWVRALRNMVGDEPHVSVPKTSAEPLKRCESRIGSGAIGDSG